MPTHLTFTTELIDTVAHFTRMLRRHKSDGFIQNRHSRTYLAAKNPRKLRLAKKHGEKMGKPKSVIRKNFLSFLMTAIRKLALYKLDL